MTNMLVTILKF